MSGELPTLAERDVTGAVALVEIGAGVPADARRSAREPSSLS